MVTGNKILYNFHINVFGKKSGWGDGGGDGNFVSAITLCRTISKMDITSI